MAAPVLFTSRSRLLYRILKEARSRGLRLKVVSSPSEISTNDGVVFTSDEEAHLVPHGKVVLTIPSNPSDKDVNQLFRSWWLVAFRVEKVKTCTVGVDPGSKRTGTAIFVDDNLLEAEVLPTMKLTEFFEDLFSSFKPEVFVVKVGKTSRRHVATVVSAALVSDPPKNSYFVEVDETSTSRASGSDDLNGEGSAARKLGGDARAAALIALRPPRGELVPFNDARALEFVEESRRRFSKGEVKSIQRASRDLSGGRLSIPRELALSVLRGEKSLEEALKEHEESSNGAGADGDA
ncbi:MAG: hypothetical protein Kow0069_18690 [Promethearchaeota archaeon]